jgi:hypothetical protein
MKKFRVFLALAVLLALAAVPAANAAPEKAFDFSFRGFAGGNTGELDAQAVFAQLGKALCKHETVTVEFTLKNGVLTAALTDGDASSLFGAGVSIDGDYTLDEPEYTNAAAPDVFGSGETKERVKKLLNGDQFEGLMAVIEDGSRSESKNLTFAGFISGAGMEAYLLLDGGKIYFLGKWLEEGAEKGYSFVTNDAEYKDKFPADMFKDAGEIDPDDLSITYKTSQ